MEPQSLLIDLESELVCELRFHSSVLVECKNRNSHINPSFPLHGLDREIGRRQRVVNGVSNGALLRCSRAGHRRRPTGNYGLVRCRKNTHLKDNRIAWLVLAGGWISICP